MKFYVASSWRNPHQPQVVSYLRALDHEVYDFRAPPDRSGFSWHQITDRPRPWPIGVYREVMAHPIAEAGYVSDRDAIRGCDACLLVLPAGKSASWELGYAQGLGKSTYVLQLGDEEPELMFREAIFCGSFAELFRAVGYGEANTRAPGPIVTDEAS